MSAAQEDLSPTRAFRSFTHEAASRGLPQATVVALHEDEQGVVWIATMGGLAKVERGIVERLRPSPDAPMNEPFNAFASRRLGGFHVAGTSGLFTWTGFGWRRSDTPGPMMALAEDGRGRLYGITTAGVAYSRPTEHEPWTPMPEVEPFAFEALTLGPQRTVLAGGLRGVFSFDEGRVGAAMCGGAPAARIRILRADGNGTVWAGADDGRVHACAPAGSQWESIALPGWTGGRIRAMSIDTRQRVWVGGDGGNVALGRAGAPFTRWSTGNGVKGASVTAVLGDRTGSVWLGFNGAGLQHWMGDAWSHRTHWMQSGDTDSMFVFSLTPRPSGGFLAAVFSRGVLAWDGQRMRAYGRADGITEDIRFAVEPEPGVIWAGGRQAIFESADGRSFRRVHTMPLGFVNGFFRSPGGEWWAATSNFGVLRREGGRWVPHEAVNARLGDQHVRHIVWRASGDVWVATARGVTALRGDTFESLAITLPAGLTAAYALIELSATEMWVAGAGGIAAGDGSSWRLMTEADGLAGATVYSLARAADGAVWAGGSEGIAMLPPGGAWRRFNVSNGLLSEETNSHGLLPLSNGDVLVGTMTGIAHFHTGSTPAPPAPLQLFWRGALAAAETRQLTVPAADRRVLLEWMAPWPRPVSVEYRTRLIGLRENWSDPDPSPELRLEGLSAGRFTVEVQARLPGTETWTPPLSAAVVVQPLWWETRLAVAAALLVLAALVIALVRWRTRRLERRAKALEEAVEEAMANMKVLRGLLPICAHCKKIRDEGGHWSRLEEYIGRHSEADFSHGLCPDCQQTHYPELTSD